MKNLLTPERIRSYLRALERSGYPYNSVIIRYAIGADNGPADKHLSQIVKEWNASIDDIKLIISTTSQAMTAFEQEYGGQIPEYRGDFTPYWEDGACSTARETAIARNASEGLTQAQTLFALTGVEKTSELEKRAWENILLFNEHTWGAHNSISQPDHAFATSQWAWKSERAVEAEKDVQMFMKGAVAGEIEFARFYANELIRTHKPVSDHQRITIYNTHSWVVSQVVEVETTFNRVLDDAGNPVPSQRLANGRLAFYAKELPPLGKRQYRFTDGVPMQIEDGCRLENGVLANRSPRVSQTSRHL